ncbi:MAG: uroporphyrinogen decarboxylase family protein [Saccharofermentanales bacterium]
MIAFDNKLLNATAIKELTSGRQPDFSNLLKILKREKPERPTLFEFFLNDEIYEELCGYDPGIDAGTIAGHAKWMMTSYRNAGYDYFMLRFPPEFMFPLKPDDENDRATAKSTSQNHSVMITDRESFKAYQWPDPKKIDLSQYKEFGKMVLPGMKAIPFGPNGVLENTTNIVGYDNMCYLLYDDPELLKDVFDKVGAILNRYYEQITALDYVGAVMVNDDWGYNTQTMLKTADMREYVIPWHKKIVETIHKAGKPAILHSCGQLAEVMEDIIDDIGFDAKHSYEDNITPVETAYDLWGKRIAIFGGIDVNFICTATPKEVFHRAAALIEKTKDSGGYALGTGNSVPYYVPKQNYYAMIMAALTWE